uniref:Uncharacterized protein n=1 Tax=Octactis speculum TaxID=3111310 RepID=A0A7S2MCL5_9STRA|mmetsp:Transcript_59572/g.81396  ORF Transcript_59572/g.81396 Transcript_59572/m.81396 type:complete len:358 (+) Transcript_59572:104-1177(+)
MFSQYALILALVLKHATPFAAPSFPKAGRSTVVSSNSAWNIEDIFGYDQESQLKAAIRPGQNNFTAVRINVLESDPFGLKDEAATAEEMSNRRLTSDLLTQNTGSNNWMDVFGFSDEVPAGATDDNPLGYLASDYFERVGLEFPTQQSVAVPFLEFPTVLSDAPSYLNAGNAGFDPLGLATDESTLADYRGAELRHARLAMLAVVGWPTSEILHPWFARITDLPSAITSLGGTAPSVLNGGLGNVSPVFWIVAVVSAVVVELTALEREASGYAPGDLGFDPLSLRSERMAEAELANGRVAMLAITAFVMQEFLSHLNGIPIPVVIATPEFFHPLSFISIALFLGGKSIMTPPLSWFM